MGEEEGGREGGQEGQGEGYGSEAHDCLTGEGGGERGS